MPFGGYSLKSSIDRLIFLLFLAQFAAACTVTDNFNYRAEEINKGTSEYTNSAILLNIVRAGNYEPLSLVGLTSFTGRNSVTGNAGLPSISLGTPAQSLYTFGPNSLNAVGSTDFNMSTADSPESQRALLTPISPYIMAFFVRQNYPRELIYYLFTSYIKRTDLKSGEFDYARNDPKFPTEYDHFVKYYGELLVAGATAEFLFVKSKDSESLPGRLCVDTALPPPDFIYGDQVDKSRIGPACASGQSAKETGPGTNSYVFVNKSAGYKYEIGLRSTLAIYQAVGRLLKFPQMRTNLSGLPDNEDPYFITVNNGGSNCFTKTTYRGAFYCVPESANTTKQVFAILSQLVTLLVKYPVTPPSTIRAVAG